MINLFNRKLWKTCLKCGKPPFLGNFHFQSTTLLLKKPFKKTSPFPEVCRFKYAAPFRFSFHNYSVRNKSPQCFTWNNFPLMWNFCGKTNSFLCGLFIRYFIVYLKTKTGVKTPAAWCLYSVKTDSPRHLVYYKFYFLSAKICRKNKNLCIFLILGIIKN